MTYVIYGFILYAQIPFRIAVLIVYYAIQLELDLVPGNTYVNAVVMGACEVPAYAAIPFATKSVLGRTGTLSIFLLLAGVSMSFAAICSGGY